MYSQLVPYEYNQNCGPKDQGIVRFEILADLWVRFPYNIWNHKSPCNISKTFTTTSSYLRIHVNKIKG